MTSSTTISVERAAGSPEERAALPPARVDRRRRPRRPTQPAQDAPQPPADPVHHDPAVHAADPVRLRVRLGGQDRRWHQLQGLRRAGGADPDDDVRGDGLGRRRGQRPPHRHGRPAPLAADRPLGFPRRPHRERQHPALDPGAAADRGRPLHRVPVPWWRSRCDRHGHRRRAVRHRAHRRSRPGSGWRSAIPRRCRPRCSSRSCRSCSPAPRSRRSAASRAGCSRWRSSTRSPRRSTRLAASRLGDSTLFRISHTHLHTSLLHFALWWVVIVVVFTALAVRRYRLG